jgi:hypothetical protein
MAQHAEVSVCHLCPLGAPRKPDLWAQEGPVDVTQLCFVPKISDHWREALLGLK